MIYDGRRQGLVEWEGQNQPKIELNDQQSLLSYFFAGESPLSTLSLAPRLTSITLFARANTSGGIVSPICFAAFKLITNSNFVACCTANQPVWRL